MGIRVRDLNICTNQSMYDVQIYRELHIIMILKQFPFRTSVKLILVHTYTHTRKEDELGSIKAWFLLQPLLVRGCGRRRALCVFLSLSGLWGSKAGTGMQLSGSRHVKNCPPPIPQNRPGCCSPSVLTFLGFRLSLPRSRPQHDLFTRRLRRPIFGTFLGLDPNAH